MAVDKKETLELIKRLLKGGTPDWYRFPQDYKRLVQEWHAEAQENLWLECRRYKVDDQDDLADPAGRYVNIMSAARFMAKLRNARLTCFSHDSPLRDHSASLFVLMPTRAGGEFRPMCSLQTPLMYEWSLLRIDAKTNLPTGFKNIGWRSAVLSLIRNGALTEDRAHQIFGKPRISVVSKRYRRILWEFRNGAYQCAKAA